MVFDRDAVREAWDRAAESYADGQAAGLDFYRCEFFGPREYTWMRWPLPFTTTAPHATTEDWFERMRTAGFAVDSIREPRPDEAAVRARPALADAARVPYFLMFDLRRST